MAAHPLVVERFQGVQGHGVLCLKGPLTTENLTLFQNAVRREEDAPTIILDLSDVPYVDSSGLGSLVGMYVSRQKSGRRVALCGVNPRVMRLLEITKMESLFLIFSDLDEAMASLSGAAQA